MSDRGDCRKAPTTLGLLNIYIKPLLKKPFLGVKKLEGNKNTVGSGNSLQNETFRESEKNN